MESLMIQEVDTTFAERPSGEEFEEGLRRLMDFEQQNADGQKCWFLGRQIKAPIAEVRLLHYGCRGASLDNVCQGVFNGMKKKHAGEGQLWTDSPLSEKQVAYAAMDAWKSEMLFYHLLEKTKWTCGNEMDFRLFLALNFPNLKTR
jgi:hypothetical protein